MVYKECENGQFHAETLRAQYVMRDAGAWARLWGRQIVREFALMVCAARDEFMRIELIAALQGAMQKHGTADRFLLELHNGVQRLAPLPQVQCWGLSAYDLHPEDQRQRRDHPVCEWNETKMLSY